MKAASLLLALLLALLLLAGCSREVPKTEVLVAHIGGSGITIGRPSGLAAQNMQNFERAANLTAGEGKPGVEFYESGGRVLLTIYRFEQPEAAARFVPLLERMKSQLKLPERVQELVGSEEFVRHGPFVVSLRFTKDNEAEKNGIVAAIASFPAK